jgi:endonuclease/exonuclease/phosphatase family metal-dependent hydrolase
MIIRLLSYNIHKGFTIGNTDFILQQIRNAIREVDADVLFLQEVLGDHNDSRCRIPDWETAIQFEYLADSVWSHFAYGKNAVYSEGHHGNAILSKFPIGQWSNQIISTNRFEQRGLLKASAFIPRLNREIIFANTHLDLTQRGRDLQTDFIINDFKKESDSPWILLGDFNDWNKKIAARIENELGAVEAFKQLHGSYPATFPSAFPILSLDRIFLHNITPIKAVTLGDKHWRKLSDHLPLYVEIEIEDPS